MTRDEIILMARHASAGFFAESFYLEKLYPLLVEAYKRGANDEREACAKVCESRATRGTGSEAILNGAADAIRSRSNKA